MKLNKYIDHTLLKPEASEEQILKLIEEAKVYDFASICVNPTWIEFAAEQLKGSDVKVCVPIGFPLGANTSDVKAFETKDAIQKGAGEVDMVINLGDAKQGDFHAITEEIKALKSICGDNILKVIIEACFLTNEEKIELCHCVTEGGADFIKTSTGFGSGGATLEDVQLFKKHIGPNVQIKAAGGIRSISDMKAYIAEGCSRIGASAAVELLKDHLDEEV